VLPASVGGSASRGGRAQAFGGAVDRRGGAWRRPTIEGRHSRGSSAGAWAPTCRLSPAVYGARGVSRPALCASRWLTSRRTRREWHFPGRMLLALLCLKCMRAFGSRVAVTGVSLLAGGARAGTQDRRAPSAFRPRRSALHPHLSRRRPLGRMARVEKLAPGARAARHRPEEVDAMCPFAGWARAPAGHTLHAGAGTVGSARGDLADPPSNATWLTH
jgi:hypothetical protein